VRGYHPEIYASTIMADCHLPTLLARSAFVQRSAWAAPFPRRRLDAVVRDPTAHSSWTDLRSARYYVPEAAVLM